MITDSQIYHLNTNWPVGFEVRTGTELGKTKNVVRATFDFAVQGGAISAISLLDQEGNAAILPDNAIITRAYVDVITTLTSATDAATIALHAESANDIVSAVAISAATDWDAGFHEGIEDGTAANFVKTTAARTLTATIAVEAVTAGKFHLFVEYVIST